MKILKLKNYQFIGSPELKSVGLHEWLATQMLHGQDSRSRTRFIQAIAPRITELDKTRIELLKKYAKKKIVKQGDKEIELPVMLYIDKETGEEMETTDESLGKRFKVEDAEGFNKEYQEYLNEDYIIDVTPSNKDIIDGVRDLLLNTKEDFFGRGALLYDEWCLAFENLEEEMEKKPKTDKTKK